MVWELNECLPSGRIQLAPAGANLSASPEFSGLRLDDVYTKIATNHGIVICRIADPAAKLILEQRFPEEFREIVAFTPPWASAICLEPYTCLTNAINLQQQNIDAGLRILPSGESWTGKIDIEVLAIE